MAIGDFSVERVQLKRVMIENGQFVEIYGKKNFIFEDDGRTERYYELKTGNNTMVLRVFPDTGLISTDFQIDHVRKGDTFKEYGTLLKGCHFSGNIVGQDSSTVVLDICRGLVSLLYP